MLHRILAVTSSSASGPHGDRFKKRCKPSAPARQNARRSSSRSFRWIGDSNPARTAPRSSSTPSDKTVEESREHASNSDSHLSRSARSPRHHTQLDRDRPAMKRHTIIVADLTPMCRRRRRQQTSPFTSQFLRNTTRAVIHTPFAVTDSSPNTRTHPRRLSPSQPAKAPQRADGTTEKI